MFQKRHQSNSDIKRVPVSNLRLSKIELYYWITVICVFVYLNTFAGLIQFYVQGGPCANIQLTRFGYER